MLKPNEDYSVLRRSISFALRDVARAVGHPGAPDRRRAHLARPPGQRPRSAAAGAVRRCSARRSTCWPAACWRLTASCCRRRCSGAWRPISPSGATRCSTARAPVATDYSLAGAVIEMQRALLGALMNDSVAQRLLDSEGKVDANGPRAAPVGAAAAPERRDLERAARRQRRHPVDAPRAAARTRQPAGGPVAQARRAEPRRRALAGARAVAGAARPHPGRGAAARA